MSSAIRPWLERLGLAQYGDRFEADDIDLDVLPSLSERLAAVYEAARTTPAARLAVVLGSPGLGKSRLIDALKLRLADAGR